MINIIVCGTIEMSSNLILCPMNKVEQKILEAFYKSKYTKRSIEGLSKQIKDISQEEILGTLLKSHYFRVEEGCKGLMWILNEDYI